MISMHSIFRSVVFGALLILLNLSCIGKPVEKLLFVVNRNYKAITAGEKVKLILDFKEVTRRLPSITEGITVTDSNFGKEIPAFFADGNHDNKVDQIIIDYVFPSNEPVYSFFIQLSKSKNQLLTDSFQIDPRLEIIYLVSATGKKISSWPDVIIESTMKFYPDATKLFINAPGKWNYEMGIFLSAMLIQSQKTKNEQYLQYVKKWADRFINAQGKIDSTYYPVKEYKLDDIMPGRPALFLYERTKEHKYQTVADQLMDQLKHQPKTSEGGYWHKEIYPYQMWLDGIYMADVFSTQYASVFNKPEFFNEAIHQIKLIAKHTTDPKTGLMYHGWDESKNRVWADHEKGNSPEFWGRAIGWYCMALVDCLDYIPENHPDRKELIVLLKGISASIVKYQDQRTNLWYQVINKGDQPGNWIETSCSAMFTYTFAKGVRNGYLDNSYRTVAQKAFDSLINDYAYFDDVGRLYLDQTVKVGTLNVKTSKGDYAYYINSERRVNDYKGLSPFLFAAIELR
jgi:unsaturated rhamnogalacturonyl hydrolase